MDGSNNDVLCQAVAKNNIDMLELLYESIKQVDDFRMYLICTDAIENSNLSALKYLVKHGANMNMDYGLSLLTTVCASENVNADIVKYLVENGANVNDTDGSGFPLISAVKRDNVDIISYLIQNGANVNPVNSDSKLYSPLTAAILYGRFDAMKLLVENGASISSVDNGWGGKTPIATAAECGSDRIYNYLKKAISGDTVLD
jgi:ankyrin repeat protein